MSDPMTLPVMPLRDVILIHVLPPFISAFISAVAVMYVGYKTAQTNAAKQELAMNNLHDTVTKQQKRK